MNTPISIWLVGRLLEASLLPDHSMLLTVLVQTNDHTQRVIMHAPKDHTSNIQTHATSQCLLVAQCELLASQDITGATMRVNRLSFQVSVSSKDNDEQQH